MENPAFVNFSWPIFSYSKFVSKPTPDVKNGITQKLQASKQAKQGEVCRHTTLETLKGQYLKQTISVSIINRLKKLYSVQYSCYIGCIPCYLEIRLEIKDVFSVIF